MQSWRNQLTATLERDRRAVSRNWVWYLWTTPYFSGIIYFMIFMLDGDIGKALQTPGFLAILTNIFPFMSVYFSFSLVTFVLQELVYKERISKAFETLLTTPVTLKHYWLAKTISASCITIVQALVSAVILALAIVLTLPNFRALLLSISFPVLLTTLALLLLFSVLFTSLFTFLYIIINKTEMIHGAGYIIIIGSGFGFFFAARYLPALDPLSLLLVTILLLGLMYRILGVRSVERIVRGL
jgi:ABC-type Na+ efflux pump permease subunit